MPALLPFADARAAHSPFILEFVKLATAFLRKTVVPPGVISLYSTPSLSAPINGRIYT